MNTIASEKSTWEYTYPGMWISDPNGRFWKVMERDQMDFVLQSQGQQRKLHGNPSGPVEIVESPTAEADALALVKKILGGVIL